MPINQTVERFVEQVLRWLAYLWIFKKKSDFEIEFLSISKQSEMSGFLAGSFCDYQISTCRFYGKFSKFCLFLDFFLSFATVVSNICFFFVAKLNAVPKRRKETLGSENSRTSKLSRRNSVSSFKKTGLRRSSSRSSMSVSHLIKNHTKRD